LAIDRDKINEVVYEGAKVATIYPFPLYPGLQKFIDTPGVKALVEKYQPAKFDLTESDKLMTGAGFKKNANGLWEKDGKTVNCVINGFEGIHSDIVPVLVEMLKTAGFDADVNFGADAYQNMADGKPGMYMFGHGASLGNPEAALQLFESRYSAAIGTTAGGNRFSRYKNPAYDKIVQAMAPLATDDPKFTELATAGHGNLLERPNRYSGHSVAPPHSLQPDLTGSTGQQLTISPGGANGAFLPKPHHWLLPTCTRLPSNLG
jgi:peptide/nickel transport system substrate-binding protein